MARFSGFSPEVTARKIGLAFCKFVLHGVHMNDLSPSTLVKATGSLRKAGSLIGVSHMTVQDWVEKGKFPHPWEEYLRLKIEAGAFPELAKTGATE